MHSYIRKREAAQQQIEQQRFPIMQDVNGSPWSGARYHIMYTDYFIGYFLYKIVGLIGEISNYGGETWWGFDIQMATHSEHSEDWEQPLPSEEVQAWLAANYGFLNDQDDYKYLIDILHRDFTPDGVSARHIRHQYNWARAIDWLNAQIAAPNASPTKRETIRPSINGMKISENPLSPAERILGVGFALEEADALAFQIGLIDDSGRFHLGGRKLGALVGFCLALKEHRKLIGKVPELTAVLGLRYGVKVKTRKGSTEIAQKYCRLTNDVLKQQKQIE